MHLFESMKIKRETKIKFFRNFLFLSIFTITILHSNLSFEDFSFDKFFLQDCYAAKNESAMNTDVEGEGTFDIISPLLVGILQLFGLLIGMSMKLIVVTFSENFLSILKNNEGIYAGWSVVRDILNLTFIFFLLYSAFCTIFQISRYHIKSTWVMIVVMALLVNFSWPITRVLIDTSNLAILYLVGNDSNKQVSGLTTKFGKESEFLTLMLGADKVTQKGNKTIVDAGEPGFFSQVLFAILISALFLITFLTVAIMLVVRIIVLAVLLVFAPVGYALAAFPSTRSQASSWWSMLMKQLIVGPVLLFCLIVSVAFLSKMNMDTIVTIDGGAKSEVAQVMKYIVSIVLVWTGIMAAQKVGADGADMALGFANKAKGKMQGWGKAMTVDAGVGVAKFTGRTAAQGANQGVAWTGNKLSTLKGDGVWKKIGRGVGTGVNVARSVPQRGKNWAQNRKDSYNETIEESRARGLSAGSNIGKDKDASERMKKFGTFMSTANEKMGGDKNAVAANKGKQIEAEKKRMKETPLNEADEIKTEAKAQSIIEKKDNVTEDNIKELIKSLNQLDGDTRKLALKKARDTGHGHLTMEYEMAELRKDNPRASDEKIREMASHKIFSGMDAKTLAKQKVAQEYAKDSGNQNLRAGFAAMQSKLNTLSAKSMADFQDALNNDQKEHLTNAKKEYAKNDRKNMSDAEEREAMRDMNS